MRGSRVSKGHRQEGCKMKSDKSEIKLVGKKTSSLGCSLKTEAFNTGPYSAHNYP